MQFHNYITGQLTAPSKGKYIEVINPANATMYAEVAASTSEDVDLAVKSALEAKDAWAKLSSDERSHYLMLIADGIEKRYDEFALAESINSGKPLSLCKKMDIPRSIHNFKFFAHAATQFSSESHESAATHTINYTLRQPLGAVACISPWNLPLYLFSWKIAPALAAGNTVVAKPSEFTPHTAYLLSQVCIDVGLPSGVLNIVHGYGHETGESIITHPDIKAVSFTGSTKVGSHIASTLAPKFKKYSLELGGKNPVMIFDDCNYEKMLNTVVRSSFINQGQICLCGSRIYIQDTIYEKFKRDFVAKTNALIIGDPLNEKTNIGAIVSKPHFEKILKCIDTARNEGGKFLHGGSPIKPDNAPDGYFIIPTIIENLSNSCLTNQEEIFGPVVTIAPFKDEAELIVLANESNYGLACSLWTENISRAHAIARQINTGIVWINTWLNRDLRTPFGGMNQSGVGREGGWEAMRFFTESKNVCIQYSE